MKRFFAVLLAVLILTLCACGTETASPSETGSSQQNPGQSNKPIQQGQEGETTPAEDSPSHAVMLQVTINPEFKLYLDAEQNIIRAETVNEDAKALFTELDVTGQPYADGMVTLLNAAYDQGYLKDGGKITIGFEIVNGEAVDFAAIAAPIDQIQRDNGITVEMSATLLGVELPTENQETDVINGQKVYIYRIPVTGNNGQQVGVRTVYASKQPGFFEDPMDHAVKSIYQGNNGEYIETYYENGAVSQFTSTMADGTIENATYYSNGNQKNRSIIYPNGDYSNDEWYENGKMKRMVSQLDGYFKEVVNTEEGVTTYLKFQDPDGTHGEEFCDEDGNRTGYSRYKPNGNYEIKGFYSDGKIKTEEYLFDGVYGKHAYREDGTRISSESKGPDGSLCKYTYHANGNMASYEDGFTSQTFYENGQVKKIVQGSLIQEFNSDGTYKYYKNETMEAFFSGGKLIKIIFEGTTYTDAESLAPFAAMFG